MRCDCSNRALLSAPASSVPHAFARWLVLHGSRISRQVVGAASPTIAHRTVQFAHADRPPVPLQPPHKRDPVRSSRPLSLLLSSVLWYVRSPARRVVQLPPACGCIPQPRTRYTNRPPCHCHAGLRDTRFRARRARQLSLSLCWRGRRHRRAGHKPQQPRPAIAVRGSRVRARWGLRCCRLSAAACRHSRQAQTVPRISLPCWVPRFLARAHPRRA